MTQILNSRKGLTFRPGKQKRLCICSPVTDFLYSQIRTPFIITLRAARSTAFNIAAFCCLAAKVVGAKTVTEMTKISESLNRVFFVCFDTSYEAMARFPTLVGPPQFSTASEVATIDFLRRQLAFPIPRENAWSSRAENTDVGAEFILMEIAPGCLFSAVWKALSKPNLLGLSGSLNASSWISLSPIMAACTTRTMYCFTSCPDVAQRASS